MLFLASVRPWALAVFTCAALLVSTRAQVDNVTLTIGAYGPFSSPWAAPSLAALVLADLDFRKYVDPAVRSRFTGMARLNGVPMPNLNPKLRVRIIAGDDAEKVNTGVKTVLDYVKGPQGRPVVNAILGGYYSEIAKPVASLCSTMEVVNIAYGGQSGELSNKDLYPYFFRTLPSDNGVGVVLWSYVKTFLWRSAVVLYSEEAFGQGIFGNMLASAQADLRAASVNGVGLKAMTVQFDKEIARTAIRRVKMANSRLVVIIIGGQLEVNTRMVMREENLTSPAYQFMSSHSTPVTITRSVDYESFDNWHSNYAYINFNNPLSVMFSMWPQMKPEDVLNKTQEWGIDQWANPLRASLFTPQFFAMFPRPTLAIMALLYNAYWALILAFNDMLNAGYEPAQIQGAPLRSYLRNVSFDGIAQAVQFDQNQDGVANYTWQYLESAPAGGVVAWTTFYIYLDRQRLALPHPSAPRGPRWATNTFGTAAPQTLAGCPPGTFLDPAANAGAGACAACPEGRISTVFDAPECQRCPAGTREDHRLSCETCPPGTASPEGSSGCTPCEAGSATDKPGQSRCSQCGLGKYQGKTGQLQCEQCAPGSVADVAGAVECSACPRGHLQATAGGVECLRCPKGSYADRTGASRCEPCGAGTETEGVGAVSAAECVCAAGTYLLLDLSGCALCPEGMECKLGSREDTLAAVAAGSAATTEYPKVLPGFWTSKQSTLSVFRCKSTKHCTGTDPETCGEGLFERSCATCAEGLFWSGSACSACPVGDSSKWVFPVIPLLLCPVGTLVFYVMFRDGLEKWGSWQNGASALAFVLLNHYQIIDLVKSCAASPPADMEAILGAFSFSVDLLGVFKLACAGFGSFESGLLIRVFAPALLVGMSLVTFAGSWLVGAVSRRTWLRMEWNRTCNVFMSLIFTFFTAIAALSLSLFKCAPNPNGKRSLINDLSIICYEDARWTRMLAVAIVAVIVYCIGVGTLLLRTVLIAPESFRAPGFAVRWKFLFIRYRPDVYWWSLTFLTKNFALNLGTVIYQFALSQLYHSMGVIVVYMVLVSIFMPYRHRVVNFVEIVVCITLTMYMAMMSLFVNPGSGQDQIGRAAAFVVFVPIALAPLALAYMFKSKIWPQHHLKTQKNSEKILKESAEVIHLLDDMKVGEFLQGLNEVDRWTVDRCCDIYCSELLDKNARTKRWRSTTKNFSEDITRSRDGVSSGTSGQIRPTVVAV